VELKGSLGNFPLPDVVQLIGSARRTGLLLITVGGNRAAIYFEEGTIVHAEYRDLAGQAAINRVFPEQEGSFQFLADAAPDERTCAIAWMGAIMEEARVTDEGSDGDFDGLDDLEGGGEPRPAAAKAPPRPAWDGARVRERMRETLREAFGRKAAKVEKELEKCPDTRLGLLDFCAKAEKYLYVFVDSARAKPVADRLRNIVEEPQG
jgi:hypothetical protein